MTPKTTKSSVRPANRAQMERSWSVCEFNKGIRRWLCVQMGAAKVPNITVAGTRSDWIRPQLQVCGQNCAREAGSSRRARGSHSSSNRGQSGNPGGKPKIHQRMSVECAARLQEPVPHEIAAELSMPPGSSWAEAVSIALMTRAATGDVSAAREVREATEGRLPVASSVESKIDYAAGQSAKQQLLKKLGPLNYCDLD